MKTTPSDLATFIQLQLPFAAPVFLMGHSYGSTDILTLASLQYEELITQIRDMILASPYFAFAPKAQPSHLLVSIMKPIAKTVSAQANNSKRRSLPYDQ